MNTRLLTRTSRRSLAALALGMLTLAAGCVYRMNIQQGNFLKPEDVDRVQAGMTRSQVRFILGTPMVADSFDGDRWDYYYSFVKGHSRKTETRHVVVRFDGDKVAEVERRKMPGASLPEPAPAAPADPGRLPDVPRT
ncbi:MAG TPA: outer membrane protein assembly factor BamE [Steroidobacteraceae bacterium]|nr:outer membrane protein assembly factor BamE [Steroidobacteraceae bacterium]